VLVELSMTRRAMCAWSYTASLTSRGATWLYCQRTFDAITHVRGDGGTETIAVEPRSPRAGHGADADADAESRALAAALEQTVCQICGSGQGGLTRISFISFQL
jgi:hypothetical protein